MASTLTIVGGALQIFGLLLVFVELAIIRSHEFGVPTPWTRAARRFRTQVLGEQPRLTTVISDHTIGWPVRAKARLEPIAPDASDNDRIARLERYVELLGRDLDAQDDELDRTGQDLVFARQHQEAEIQRRDEERRAALRPSLRRQGIGAVCVLLGTIAATVGGVL